MRRFLTLVCLLCLAVPAGISISGCTRNPGANYCNGLGYGQKITDVYSITLGPYTQGISLAFGQTQQANAPTALTCKGSTASVAAYTYGTTNNQLVDISPTGVICAGTWNRNTGGGIANYTICNPPNPTPVGTNGLPYGTAYISASAQAVTSNPVEVYVHPQVTAISLVGPTSCQSQGVVSQLDANAYYSNNGAQALLCSPGTVNCSNVIGPLAFTVGTQSIAEINNLTNQITAELPGTTEITASVSHSGSSAGFFSTCPPASISVSLSNGTTAGTVSQGAQQNLITTVKDTNGQTITGLNLDYQSTDPADISVSNGGGISASFPGTSSVYAVCQPPNCNPAPINVFGQNGTGLSITSNSVNISTPGTASQYVWYGAPGQSQYYVPVELLSGTIGAPVRLPYVPNSMVSDKGGTNLYFGSSHELMIYSAVSNSLSKQDTNAPGVVLAVSPDNSELLINDQVRQVFYLYSETGGVVASFGGMGTTAAWTPDIKTLYIADTAAVNCAATGISGHTDTLYVYNQGTGFTSYPLPSSGNVTCKNNPSNVQGMTVTVPSVGAFIGGETSTVSHTWCPTGTVGNYASLTFYPQADAVAAQTDVLASTTDGNHILGAAYNAATGVTLTDIGVTVPDTECKVTTTGTGANQVQTLSALSTNPTVDASLAVNVKATGVNQVVVSPASKLAFITYNGTTAGATLPYYQPSASGPGTLSYLTLAGASAVTAPVWGAFSPDSTLFFVSTAGDNKIHYISIPTVSSGKPTDSQQISPNLPACVPVSAGGNDLGCAYTGTGTVVPATAIVVRPRSTT